MNRQGNNLPKHRRSVAARFRRKNRFKEKANKLRGNETFVDDDTYNYFQRILETLDNKFDDPDEKEIFITNVLNGQFSGKEITYACTKIGSLVLEKLLLHGTILNMKPIMIALENDYGQACTSNNASRVTEKAMQVAFKALVDSQKSLEENETRFLISWVENLSEFVIENVDHLLFDLNASHVLRTLIKVLSGWSPESEAAVSLQDSLPKKKAGSQADAHEMKEDICFDSISSFKGQLEKLTKRIIQMKEFHYAMDDCRASCVLQILLLALHKQQQHDMCQLLIDFILKNTNLLAKPELGSELPVCVTSKIYTYIIETILKTSTDAAFNDLFLHFLPYVQKMAIHSVANFVLQKLIAECRNKEQFQSLLQELKPAFRNIIDHKTTCVLIQIVEKSIAFRTQQKAIVKHLKSALGYGEDSTSIAELILTLLPLDKYNNSDLKTGDEVKPLSFGSALKLNGSLLLQKMLNFKKPKQVVDSILAMAPPLLAAIACNRHGSFLIEAFLGSSNLQDKDKKQLISQLKGQIALLACDKYGSRVVDNIWNYCDLTLKISIAEELTEATSQLKGNEFGKHFLHRFGLYHFSNHLTEWKQIMGNTKQETSGDSTVADPVSGSNATHGKRQVPQKSFHKKKQNWYQ